MTTDKAICELAENDAKRATRAASFLEQTDSRDHNHPLGRIRDASNGQPRAASYDRDTPMPAGPHATIQIGDDHDPDRGWRRAIADPTGEAACRPDPADRDRREIVRILKAKERLGLQLEEILHRWEAPRPATAYERAQVAKENIVPEPGCEHCATIDQAKGVPYWSPIAGKISITNAAGDMESTKEIAVCQDCRAYFRGDGRHEGKGELPPKHWLENRRDGKRNKWEAA